jgi:hypothetical protein
MGLKQPITRAGRFEGRGGADALSAAEFGLGPWSGFTPWCRQDGSAILWFMDNKAWLLEMEVAACFVAVAIVAFALMLGSTLWKRATRKQPQNAFLSP